MNDAKNKQKGPLPVARLGAKLCPKIGCPFSDIENESEPNLNSNLLPEQAPQNPLEKYTPSDPPQPLPASNSKQPLPMENGHFQNLPVPGISENPSLEMGKGNTENHYPNTTYNIRANQYAICMDSKTIRIDEYNFCKKKIRELALPMRLIQTSYLEEDKRLVFFFTAPERVDFRELLRALRQQYFGIRIELRQIGQRDAASLLGGVGICGCELCCCSFLRSFSPITAKIAKKVGPTPNPAMYCGLCGRLRCCLRYEESDGNHGNEEEADPDWNFFEDQ